MSRTNRNERSKSIRELDCLRPFNSSPENSFFSEDEHDGGAKPTSENNSSDDEPTHKADFKPQLRRSRRKRKESGGALLPESQSGSPSKSPATSPERTTDKPNVSSKLTLEVNGALKNHDVPKLMTNKSNFMQFQNGMYEVSEPAISNMH
jgi:hypothetical protein